MFRKYLITITIAILFFHSAFSQEVKIDIRNYKTSIESPYRLNKKKDLIVGISSAALITTGFVLKSMKTPIDTGFLLYADLDAVNIDKIPKFDLSAIHQYNSAFVTTSDILEYTAMAMPFLSFFDKRVSGHAPQIIALYFEALAVDGAFYNMTTGITNRRRPLTYNHDSLNGAPVVPLSEKQGKNVKESFFSGHTSNAATATFFGAKIFTDLRPHSALIPFVWTAAAAVPAFTAYSRYKAGKHFPSDVVVGYLVGASVGYFVPALHRLPAKNLSLYPTEHGLGMVYQF